MLFSINLNIPRILRNFFFQSIDESLELTDESSLNASNNVTITSVENSEYDADIGSPQVTIETESTDNTIKKTFKSPIKKALKRKQQDEMLFEAYSFLKRAATTSTSRPADDECATFGNLVANKLRKFSETSRAVAQHRINNILFEIEMKELNASTHTPSHVSFVQSHTSYIPNNYTYPSTLSSNSYSTTSTPATSPLYYHSSQDSSGSTSNTICNYFSTFDNNKD